MENKENIEVKEIHQGVEDKTSTPGAVLDTNYEEPIKSKHKLDMESTEVKNNYLFQPSLPMVTLKKINKDIENQEDSVLLSNDNLKDISEEQFMKIQQLQNSFNHTLDYALGDDIYKPEGRFTNNYQVEDKKLGVEYLKHTLNNKGNVKSNVMRFKSLLGIGRPVNITLFHSGFNIKLKPISLSALTSLELSLYNEEKEFGKSTLGLLVSADKMHTLNTISNFLSEYILDSTLNYPEDKSILDYISILDLDTILLAVLHSTNVNKITMNRTCSNITKINPNDPGSMCTFTESCEVDPGKLLFINKDRLTDTMVKQLSHRTKNIITIEEYEAYQRELKKVLLESKLIKEKYTVAGLNFDLKIPTISEYRHSSNIVVEKVHYLIDKVNKANETNQIEKIMDRIDVRVSLSKYLCLINSISIEHDDVVESLSDQNEIAEILEDLTKENDDIIKLTEMLHKYYHNNIIALVAFPNYVCPECRKDQPNTSETPGFEDEFIPLNMIPFFLYLDPRLRV